MRRTVLFALCLSLAGCGGGLKYVIDGQFLGDVPTDEKKNVFEAQVEVLRTQDEVHTARYQVALAAKEIEVTNREYDAAKIELDRAKAEKDFAVTTQDQNKIVPAEAKVEVARLAIDAAALKQTVVKAKQAYAAEQEALLNKRVMVDLAKVEQERVRVIVAKNKKPSADFDPKIYDQQVADLQQEYEAAKLDVDKKRAAVTEAENAYNEAKRALDAKMGISTTPTVSPVTTPPPATTTTVQQPAPAPQPAPQPAPEPAPAATP